MAVLRYLALSPRPPPTEHPVGVQGHLRLFISMVITGDDEPKTEMPTELGAPPLNVELNSYGFPQGYFMLRCIGAARVLDVAQGFVEDGTDVILWHPTDSSQVECKFTPIQQIPFELWAQTSSCI